MVAIGRYSEGTLARIIFGSIWTMFFANQLVPGLCPVFINSLNWTTKVSMKESGTCFKTSATRPHSSADFCIFIRWIALYASPFSHAISVSCVGWEKQAELNSSRCATCTSSFNAGAIIIKVDPPLSQLLFDTSRAVQSPPSPVVEKKIHLPYQKHTWRLASIKTACAWRLPFRTTLQPRTCLPWKKIESAELHLSTVQ